MDASAPNPIRIALSTVGSTGDIQPFLALGKALIARGHDVIALSHPFHGPRFEQVGIPFRPCGPMVAQDDINKVLDSMMAVRNPVKQLKVLLNDAFLQDGEAYFHAAKAALEGREIMVSHMIDFIGQEAAAQLGIPRIGVVLTHSIIPTAKSTPALVPDLGPFNPLIWRLATAMMRGVSRSAEEFLRSLGGPSFKIERFCALGPDLNIIAASALLAGVDDADLPAHVRCSGAWILEDRDYTPDPALAAFLARHPRPVIVSLGSMGGSKGPELTRTLLSALKILGLPAIIQGGYAGLHTDQPGEDVFFAGFVPHEYLFAQGCCVVHHGGAGTTMAACRAGVPSVVIAFIADQPYFARQMQKLGISPKFIWHRNLSEGILAKRIRQALEGGVMGRKAGNLRTRFREEGGTALAIAWIEAYAGKLKDKDR